MHQAFGRHRFGTSNSTGGVIAMARPRLVRWKVNSRHLPSAVFQPARTAILFGRRAIAGL